MTSLFPPFTRRTSFRKQPYFFEAGRGVYYKSLGYSSPALNLNFTTGTLDSRITFSRGTNATLTDSTGKITYAPSNRLLYSEQLSNAAWNNKTNVTVGSTPTTAPDGTLSAYQLTENSATGAHFIAQTLSTSAPGNTTQIFSAYCKNAGARYVILSFYEGTTGTFNAGGQFDLQNGVTAGTWKSGGTTPTLSITNVGNGWYRCSIIWTTTGGGASSAPIIYLNRAGTFTADPNSYTGYAGDGTSGAYIWGTQIENVTYQTTPSTYVATTASAYYGPRFDYDPTTLQCKGLLIEEQRTNLLTYSDQFDNAAWAKNDLNTTGTPAWVNVATAPDGAVTADKLTENTATSFHYIDRSVSISANTTYTFSVYLKAGERTFGGAHIYENGAARGCSINLTTGALGTPYGGASASAISVGNGWYRLSVTITSASTSSTALPAIYVSNTNALASYTGNGTSGILIWGAQLETGAFATSYIPTTSATVTRSADVASMTGSNFSSWYNQSAGTIYTQFDGPASGTRSIVAVDDNTANNNISLYTSTTDPKFLVTSGGVAQADIDAGTVAATTQYKFIGAYAANDFSTSIAGGAVVTDTSGTVPTVDRLRIGTNQAANYLNGHIASIVYYNKRLPNATLQQLTLPSLVPSMSLVFDTSSNSYIDANWSP